jgi:hypothetical protein
MKRVSLLLLVSCAAFACASEAVEAPPPLPVDWKSLNSPPRVAAAKGLTAKERMIAEAYVAALASPRLAGIGPLFDEVGHVAFGRKDARGRDKVVDVHERLFGAFDDRKAATSRVWRTDDMQIVEWVMTGTQAREWMGVAPTQRPVVIRGVSFLWTQDEGTVMDAHLYFSVPVVKAELGVGPKELQDYVASVAPLPPAMIPLDQEKSDAEAQELAVTRAMLDALEQGKEADYVAAYAPSVELETLTKAKKTLKKDDIRAYYSTMRRSIGQLDTTIVSVHAVHQFVLLEYLISGEQYSAVGYTPAPADHAAWIEQAEVLEMTDNKIAHVWRYENPDWPQ